jgi:uncharacterized DUF497 family protein
VLVEFEWDAAKALRNLLKHGVRFDEAKTVFADTLSVTIPDESHSEGERRFLTIGLSSVGRLVVVAHTDRGARIRIIGARLASSRERRQYEGQGRA